MSRFILALDQGTTSSRAILYDRDGRPTGQAQREFEQRFPRPGWVEHDPEAIWSSQLEVAEQVLAEAEVSAADVAAIGITNQRETTLVWDRKTGEPIYPAIVWQDRRTAGACAALREAGREALVQQRAGLVLDAYFSASKVRWILDHVEGAHERAERGELAFGTVDSWLVYRLTDRQCHVTDPTNASRTMLYDLQRGAWDDELLQLFGLSASLLPRVVASSGVIGEAAVGGLKGIAIASIVGDQQAALFGQRCTRPGMVKNTYGTGCFMLMHTGEEKRDSKHRLLTTAAAGGGGHAQFALEGSVFIGGAVVQWLRDGLGLVKSAAEVEQLATTVEDNGGVYLVPAFAGLGAPYWDPLARGVAMGLTRGTTAGHLARAALEGIAFQVADVLDVMQQDAGTPIKELRVDGGAAANDLLMQFQADVLRVPVVRPVDTESTALGAATLAGLATGFWVDGDELDARWQSERTFEPAMDAERAAWLRGQWSRALSRCRDWDRDEETIV